MPQSHMNHMKSIWRGLSFSGLGFIPQLGVKHSIGVMVVEHTCEASYLCYRKEYTARLKCDSQVARMVQACSGRSGKHHQKQISQNLRLAILSSPE